MGTRGLTAVILDEKFKVAQYGQWDHYPEGQGATICEFIQNQMDLDKFKQAVRECTWITTEEHKALWAECGADPEAEWVSMDVSNRFGEKYPHLSRDAGGDILKLIQDEGARKLQDSLDFTADSLFCEYAYVVDLDNEVLEVYKGFNKSKLAAHERFGGLTDKATGMDHRTETYHPVKLYRKFSFAIATPYAMTQLSQCGYREDEDGNELPPLDPMEQPDDFFVDGSGLLDINNVEPKAPLVVQAFDGLVEAISTASDEDMLALREFVQDTWGTLE